jgi:hypothetical protein
MAPQTDTPPTAEIHTNDLRPTQPCRPPNELQGPHVPVSGAYALDFANVAEGSSPNISLYSLEKWPRFAKPQMKATSVTEVVWSGEFSNALAFCSRTIFTNDNGV